MTKELIKKYGIDFRNTIFNSDGFPAIVDKFPYTKLGYLTMMLSELSIRDINDSLLPNIDEALADSNSEIENGSGIVEITIYHDVVKFYVDGDNEIYSMPTADFKEIVIGWKDFLLTQPLNGTRV
jgi:hypothetical protein